MPNENVAVIRAIYDAFAEGDMKAATALMSPAIVWNEAENFPYADENPYRGPEAVLNGVLARLGSEWENFAAVPQEFLAAGDSVVVLGRYRGSYKATGKPINAQMAHVWHVEAGRAASFQQYVDTLQVARATGAA
jgi:ketosteroid isomerase-like protein